METSSMQLCEDLVRLVKHLKHKLAGLAEKRGLTLVQLQVLRSIQSGALTMSGVADSLHCDASNATGIVDRLVALGMVSRRESEQDRRTKLISLTPKSEKSLTEITKDMPAALGCSKLSASEQTTLRILLGRLI